jgi:hypothetical protein
MDDHDTDSGKEDQPPTASAAIETPIATTICPVLESHTATSPGLENPAATATASPVLENTENPVAAAAISPVLKNLIAVKTPVDVAASPVLDNVIAESSTALVPTLQSHPMPQAAPIPIDPALIDPALTKAAVPAIPFHTTAPSSAERR